VSCPNQKGVADLQQRDPFLALASRILAMRAEICGTTAPPPVLAKLSPDLDDAQQEELAAAALESGIDGLVLTNTTTTRPAGLPPAFAQETGGLSGRPLKEKSTATIRNFYRLTGGKLPIIGVGGIASGADAYEKIRAGASLVQLYTGMIYEGPGVAGQINRDLLALLKADGFTTIADAIGADHC
ncbi:MAG: dihydroorotate dehydrogenase (quinone), partial [Alphaproteobacteria bacterium]|nr:dihydroorotate dehydrogenase (quinone) [Alphaproteobacteria bacterium]